MPHALGDGQRQQRVTQPRTRRRSGALPSVLSRRERWVPQVTTGLGSPLESVSQACELRSPAPRNQQNVPCCVSMAIVAALEILDAMGHPGVTRLSPLFHYYLSRASPSRLADVPLSTGLATAEFDGICRAAEHDPPMTAAGARERPTASAWENARRQRLQRGRLGYRQLGRSTLVDDWKQSLHGRYPVIALIQVTDAYWQLALGGADVLRPKALGLTPAWHAVVSTGFDFDRPEPAFHMLDSRGAEFGDGGRWWLPIDVAASALVWEAYAIHRITYDD